MPNKRQLRQWIGQGVRYLIALCMSIDGRWQGGLGVLWENFPWKWNAENGLEGQK